MNPLNHNRCSERSKRTRKQYYFLSEYSRDFSSYLIRDTVGPQHSYERTRIVHHSCGASLGIRYHSTFASLTNTESIRSVTESTVISNTVAIHSLSGELSRLAESSDVFPSICGSIPNTNAKRNRFSCTQITVINSNKLRCATPLICARVFRGTTLTLKYKKE